LLDAGVHRSNPQEPVHLYYPNGDLLTPLTRRRGLRIGNLTRQCFANVYLGGLNHLAKVLRAPYMCCATTSRFLTTTRQPSSGGVSAKALRGSWAALWVITGGD
jgi:hypothetical protein